MSLADTQLPRGSCGQYSVRLASAPTAGTLVKVTCTPKFGTYLASPSLTNALMFSAANYGVDVTNSYAVLASAPTLTGQDGICCTAGTAPGSPADAGAPRR